MKAHRSLGHTNGDDRGLRFWAMGLSVAVGLLMVALKGTAYALTGSTAILGDVAESVVHVGAVLFAAYSLYLSTRPPDRSHLYGHAKVGFISAGFEGAAILFAAGYIGYESILALIQGPELGELTMGAGLIAGVVVINTALGAFLLGVARRHQSLILQANGHHVLTDAVTSLGVLVALGLVHLTGWTYWDPICGLAVAGHILISGTKLIRLGWRGLMDEADPVVHERIARVLDAETARHGISYHALRYRDLGNMLWVDFHLLFPDAATIKAAHRVATEIEVAVDAAFRRPVYVTTHLEPEGTHAADHAAAGRRSPF